MTILGSEFLVSLLLVNIALTYSVYPMQMVGRLSVAPVAFMGIGAYSSVYVTTRGGSIVVGSLIGLGLAVLVAGLFSLVAMRLRSHYFVIASLGLVLVARQLAFNLSEVTGGYLGVTGIPQVVSPWHLLVAVVLIAALFFLLEGTRVGRSWRAMGDDDRIAATLGVSPRAQFLSASILSASIAAVAGALYGHSISYLDPNSFGFLLILDVVAFVIVGGSRRWFGPIVGAAVVTLLPEVLRPLGEVREIVKGLVLLIVILFLPQGLSDGRALMDLVRNTRHRIRRRGNSDTAEALSRG